MKFRAHDTFALKESKYLSKEGRDAQQLYSHENAIFRVDLGIYSKSRIVIENAETR